MKTLTRLRLQVVLLTDATLYRPRSCSQTMSKRHRRSGSNTPTLPDLRSASRHERRLPSDRPRSPTTSSPCSSSSSLTSCLSSDELAPEDVAFIAGFRAVVAQDTARAQAHGRATERVLTNLIINHPRWTRPQPNQETPIGFTIDARPSTYQERENEAAWRRIAAVSELWRTDIKRTRPPTMPRRVLEKSVLRSSDACLCLIAPSTVHMRGAAPTFQ